MSDFAATPETGPADSSSSMSSVLAEFATEAPPKEDAVNDVVSELVKETEDASHAKAPDADESATDPTEPDDVTNDDPPEETPDPDEPKHKVKVNGEELEVPLSELLKGYSRTEDYKSKTMALADERRALDTAKTTVEADVRGQYANELKQIADIFEATDPILAEAKTINWEQLKQNDPATFVTYSDAVQQRLQMLEQARGQIKGIEAERAQQAEAAETQERQTRLAQSADKIIAAMPELAEEGKFSAFAGEAIDYLREIGFSQDELHEAVDDRALIMADKARKWDAQQKARAALPGRKIVTKSAVRPLTSDASDPSRATAAKITSGMSRDARLSSVLSEFMKDQ